MYSHMFYSCLIKELTLTMNGCCCRANASLNLENQIRKVDGIVSGFEKQMSRDGPVLDFPNALQNRIHELQVSTEF